MFDLAYINERYFQKAVIGYAGAKAFLLKGRDPYGDGRKYTTSFNMRLATHDNQPVVEIFVHDKLLARMDTDNIVEFVATDKDIYSYNHTLSGHFHKILPMLFIRTGKGKYNVITAGDLTPLNKLPPLWKIKHSVGTPYFQHLKLDLNTGKVINPKTFERTVDTDKRKQWISGLKQTRLKLRAAARIGALDHMPTPVGYHYMTRERIEYIADCIMKGGLDPQAIDYINDALTGWQRRRVASVGEGLVMIFERTVKSYSEEMRTHVGVLDMVEK